MPIPVADTWKYLISSKSSLSVIGTMLWPFGTCASKRQRSFTKYIFMHHKYEWCFVSRVNTCAGIGLGGEKWYRTSQIYSKYCFRKSKDKYWHNVNTDWLFSMLFCNSNSKTCLCLKENHILQCSYTTLFDIKLKNGDKFVILCILIHFL